jgi:hypothetical protein
MFSELHSGSMVRTAPASHNAFFSETSRSKTTCSLHACAGTLKWGREHAARSGRHVAARSHRGARRALAKSNTRRTGRRVLLYCFPPRLSSQLEPAREIVPFGNSRIAHAFPKKAACSSKGYGVGVGRGVGLLLGVADGLAVGVGVAGTVAEGVGTGPPGHGLTGQSKLSVELVGSVGA